MPKRPAVDEGVTDPLAGLTLKERRFVEAYVGEAAGNGTRAARLAGYGGGVATHSAIGSENLRKPPIRDAIAHIVDQDELVAGRIERLRFMTRVMRGEERDQRLNALGELIEVRTPTHVRLRAAEKLAELAGDFRQPDKTADGLPDGLSVEQLFDLAGIPRGEPEQSGAN
jgi:phage terminase small subunit